MATSSSISTTYITDTSAKGSTGSTWGDTYKWLIGWIVAIVLLSLINKTRVGHVAIYYWLWALIIFLVVTQYRFIADALSAVDKPVPGGGQA